MKKLSSIGIAFITALSVTTSSFGSVFAAAAPAVKSAAAAEYDADKSVLAYAVLGETVESNGLNVWMGDKNEPSVLVESGKNGWNMDPSLAKESRYIYVDIDDDLVKFNPDGHNIEVTVEYFDKGVGSLVLEYPDLDTKNSLYTQRMYDKKTKTVTNLESDILDFTDSKTWKKHTWVLQHPSLGNEMNGADFRVSIHSTTMGYSLEEVLVSSIAVSVLGTRSQIDIDISSDHLGNIYFTGEEMNFDITFDNSINPVYASKNGTYTADAKYTITDSRQNVVFEQTNTLTINPKAKTHDKITFKPEKYDLYVLTAEIYGKDANVYSVNTAKCSYSWTTYGEIKNPRAGISISRVVTKEAEDFAKLLRNAGFTYVRHHFPFQQFATGTYNSVEPYAVEQHQGYTEYMAALAKYGLTQTGYISSSYSQVASSLPAVDVGGTGVPTSERGYKNFRMYNRSVLNIFGDTLDVYGLDNEMDIHRPISEDDANASTYGTALIKSYNELKSEFPDITFVAGETSGVKEPWWTDFLNTGAGDYTDVLSGHIYTWSDLGANLSENGTGYYANVNAVRRLMEEHGIEDKELWLTEYGYSAFHNACKSEYQQACWDVMHYAILSAPGQFDKLFKFQFNNGTTENRSEREYNFGLIRAANYDVKDRCAAKSSYLSNSAMNILMHDAEQIERINMGQTICYRYNKTSTDEQMALLFKNGEGEADTVSLSLGTNEITFYDMYGNASKLSSPDGTFTIAVDMEPLYIVGNFTKFQKVESSAVCPNSTLRSVSYDDAADVGFTNTTGKELTAEISYMGNSEIIGDAVAAIPAGGGKIHFKFGSSAPKGIEPVHITLKSDDGKVYFDDDIFFKYSQPLALEATLNIDANRQWYIETTLSNYASEAVYDGTLQLVSPADWMNRVEKKHLTINPGETIVEKLVITDRDESLTRLTASVAFVTDESTKDGVYINKIFDFAYAPKVNGNITIDGDLSEWSDGWMYLNRADQFEASLGYDNIFYGSEDLWARLAVKWDEDNFYFAGEVHDDVHYTSGVDESSLWQVDSFQLGIAYDPTNSLGSSAFEEIAISEIDGTPKIYRHLTTFSNLAKASEVAGAELAVKNDGKVTYYELKIPWSSLISGFAETGGKIEAGNEIKFGALLNENDGTGRKGWYKLGDGIANTKNSSQFTKLFMMD